MTTLRIGVDSTRVRTGVREAVRAHDELRTSAITTTAALGRQQRTTDALGSSSLRAARSVGLLIGAVVGIRGVRDAIGGYADYETALVGIGKTAGISGPALQQLGRDFQSLSLQIPEPTTKLLEIGAAAAQLGVRGSKDLRDFTRVISELASAAPSLRDSADEAALAIARILTLTREAPSDADRFTSVLVRLGNELEAQEAGILNTARRVAQGTALFRIGSSDVLSLAGALESLGIESEIAGSALQRALIQIQQAVREQNSQVAEELEQLLGDSIQNIGARLEQDAFQLLIDFLEALPSSAAGAEAALARLEIQDRRVFRVLGVLSTGFEKLQESINLTTDELRTQDSRAREAARSYDTLKGATGLLANTVRVGLNQRLEASNKVMARAVVFGRDVAATFLGVEGGTKKASAGAQAFTAGLKVAAATFSVLFYVAKFDDLITDIRTTTVATRILNAATGQYYTVTKRATVASALFGAALNAIRAHPIASAAVALGVASAAISAALRALKPEIEDLRPGLINLEGRFLDLSAEAATFQRGLAQIARGQELDRLDDQLQGTLDNIQALDAASVNLRAAIATLREEGNRETPLISVDVLKKLIPIAAEDIDDYAASVEQGLIDTYNRVRSDTGSATAALQAVIDQIGADARFEFQGGQLSSFIDSIDRGFEVKGQRRVNVPIRISTTFDEDAQVDFLQAVQNQADALARATGGAALDQTIPRALLQPLLDAYKVTRLEGEIFVKDFEKNRARLETQADALRDALEKRQEAAAVTPDPTRDQTIAAEREYNRLAQEQLQLLDQLNPSLDTRERLIRAAAASLKSANQIDVEAGTLHAKDAELLDELIDKNADYAIILAAREESERKLAEAQQAAQFEEEARLRIADKVRDDNLLVFATAENAVRQFGSALGGAIAGFEDFGAAARRSLQNVVAAFADAIAQALIFKFIVGPLLGGFGLDTAQLRRELNVPELGILGLQRGGVFGSGILSEAQITNRPTPFTLPQGQGIGVASEFNQPELLLRGRNATAVLPLGGAGGVQATLAGGGGRGGQTNHYEFHQNNYFPSGTSNDEGLRRSLRGFKRDFRTFVTSG